MFRSVSAGAGPDFREGIPSTSEAREGRLWKLCDSKTAGQRLRGPGCGGLGSPSLAVFGEINLAVQLAVFDM